MRIVIIRVNSNSTTSTEVVYILYSRKVWRGENLGEFGESPLICQTKTIQISTYWIYSFAKLFFAKYSKKVNSQNFLPTKLSCYMVLIGCNNFIDVKFEYFWVVDLKIFIIIMILKILLIIMVLKLSWDHDNTEILPSLEHTINIHSDSVSIAKGLT